MLTNSSLNIADFNNGEACNNIPGDIARYATASTNISWIPFGIRFGFCLPKQCSQSQFNNVGKYLTDLLNQNYKKFYDFSGINTPLTTNGTTFQIRIFQLEEQKSNYYKESKIAFTMILCVLSLVISTIFVFPNFLATYRFFIQQQAIASRISSFGNIKSKNKLSADYESKQKMNARTQLPNELDVQPQKYLDFKDINLGFEQNYKRKESDPFSFGPNLELGNTVDLNETKLTQKHIRRKSSAISDLIENESFTKQFTIISAYQDLIKSRNSDSSFHFLLDSKQYNEMDAIDGFKFFIYLCFLCAFVTYMVLLTPIRNITLVFSFNYTLFLPFIVNTYMMMDGLLIISTFIATNQGIKIFNINNGFTRKTLLNFFLAKFLRIVPLYYLVFFFGWFVASRSIDGPFFYEYQWQYWECEKYWWTKILLLGNMVPFNTAINYGCMNWTWFIDCDIQLFLLIPIHIIFYKRQFWLSLVTLAMLVGANIIINYSITDSFKFRGNIMTFGNEAAYGNLVVKPYCKFYPHCTGVLLSFIYQRILKYREVTSISERITKYPILDLIHGKKIISQLSQGLANLLFMFSIFISYHARYHQKQWEGILENLYYTAIGILVNFAFFLYFMTILVGHDTMFNKFFASVYLRILGRLVYPAALVGPIILFSISLNQDVPFNLTYLQNFMLYFGTIFILFLSSAIIYFMIEYPLKKILRVTLIEWMNGQQKKSKSDRRDSYRTQNSNDLMNNKEEYNSGDIQKDINQKRENSVDLNDIIIRIPKRRKETI